MRTLLAALILGTIAARAAAAGAPPAGLYYDRERSGHGLDMQTRGDQLSGVFFSYAANGQPAARWPMVG